MAVNVIAIDGPAASGKSSAARLLAEAIPGSVYVNTGSMYRAVAWKARKCGQTRAERLRALLAADVGVA